MLPADPIAAVTHADPYPYYRELARTRPFHFDPALKLWVAASAEAVANVLGHTDTRVRPVGQTVPPALAGSAAGELFGRLIRMNDGPAHAALKAIVMARLMSLDLGRMRVRTQQLAAALPRATADDAHEAMRWMFTLPVLAVADALGLPLHHDEDGHVSTRTAGFVATFAAAMSPLASAADVDAGSVAAQWLIRSVEQCADTAPRDGLLAVLREDALLADIAPAVWIANAIGLMIQTCEATAGSVGNTLVALGRGPASASDDIDAIVARVAHDDPPVQNTRRFMAADAVVCGQTLRAGDTILVLLAAAAHDADGARPAEDRPWTFGTGRHGCPGAALAQVLAACTLQALLDRGVRPERLLPGLRYRPSVNARIPQFQ